MLLTQLWLVVTGNFAWLNWATIVLAFSAIGIPGIGGEPDAGAGAGCRCRRHPAVLDRRHGAVGLLYAVLSWWPLRNLFARRQLMNASFNRYQLANAYGAFGTVTKERIEIVVEGTMDADPYTTDWHEYSFKGKPGDLRRIPRQYAPYHLRLDWLMWFLPLGRLREPWFEAFLLKLLEADAATLACSTGSPSTAAAHGGCAPARTSTASPRARSAGRRASTGCASPAAWRWAPPACRTTPVADTRPTAPRAARGA